MCVSCMFSNSQESCPWLCPYGVINITFYSAWDTTPALTRHKQPDRCVRSDTHVRLGVLEDDEGQGEVSLGQVDQVLSEQ